MDQDQLEDLRQFMLEMFREMMDDTGTTVRYEDECPDCFRKGCKGECCKIPEDD